MTTAPTRSIDEQIVADPEASCDPALADGPWIFDLVPGYGPGCSEDDVIPEPVTRPGQLPVEYQKMSDDELHERIRVAKEKLGERVVILGHFYQRDEVVQYADFVGDSFQLANAALRAQPYFGRLALRARARFFSFHTPAPGRRAHPRDLRNRRPPNRSDSKWASASQRAL